MYFVRNGAFSGFENLVSRYGGNPIELIHEAGFTLAQFRDPNNYISYNKVAYLLERCAQVSKHPLFGLELSQVDNLTVLGDLPITIAQEINVGAALTSLNRHLYLVANGVHVGLQIIKKQARISLNFDFSSSLGIEQLIQKSVADTANILYRLTDIGSDQVSIHLRQLEPSSGKPFKKLAPSNVCFSADFDGLIIPQKILKQPNKIDEATVQLHFQEQLKYLSRRYPRNIKNQTKEIIGQLLPTGDCSISRVAANLNIQCRMLQIKLQAEGVTYGKLLRETRQCIAEQHLKYNLAPITDLALNLGFADLSIFSRQFKSWTGYSPSQWRRNTKLNNTSPFSEG